MGFVNMKKKRRQGKGEDKKVAKGGNELKKKITEEMKRKHPEMGRAYENSSLSVIYSHTTNKKELPKALGSTAMPKSLLHDAIK